MSFISSHLSVNTWFPYRNIIKSTKYASKYSLNMRIIVCTPFVLVSCHAWLISRFPVLSSTFDVFRFAHIMNTWTKEKNGIEEREGEREWERERERTKSPFVSQAEYTVIYKYALVTFTKLYDVSQKMGLQIS